MEDKKPIVSLSLVLYLESIFEDKAPDCTTPYNKVMEMSGSAKVVRLLRQIYEQQKKDFQENVLT